ncbi:MAG: DUF4276 family protein [Candidatus Delongbacteria bacterium]|nr:DUF4276 family protein [Candidatus Delongbacteria bacterium]
MLVEGEGEVHAAGNLIARLSADLGLQLHWAPPIRWPNLHCKDAVERGASFIRSKPDAELLLILRDEDDGCPKDLGPRTAEWVRQLNLPFPAAVVLLNPEYEVLFLPCIDKIRGKHLDGRPGLQADAEWVADSFEAHRGVKEWLTQQFPRNRTYKPTLDQLPMTRMLDFATLRSSGLSCFGTLERALSFLNQSTGQNGVYPS